MGAQYLAAHPVTGYLASSLNIWCFLVVMRTRSCQIEILWHVLPRTSHHTEGRKSCHIPFTSRNSQPSLNLSGTMTTNETDATSGLLDSRRRNARIAFLCYRLAFALSLVALSTLATLVRTQHQDSGADLLLAYHEQNRDSIRRHLSAADSVNRDTEVYFLDSKQMAYKDGFSASWLQTRATFMDMNLDSIQTCEDAAFRAYSGKRKNKMRMTLDWMDWSVEHVRFYLCPWPVCEFSLTLDDDPLPLDVQVVEELELGERKQYPL